MTVKIALIGAGSRSFGPATLRDVALSDSLCKAGVELALMDIVAEHLPENLAYGQQVMSHLGRNVSITSGTDLDAALDGADYVVTAIEVERYLYWAQDFHIPRQYGFRQIYGENGGPGGLFHALRNMGPMLHIAERMQARCPQAPLLNFTNPESKLCQAVNDLTGVTSYGLCHGVAGGRRQIAAFLDMPVERLDTTACGMNHITWFQTIRDKITGEDLYPLLRERERQADVLAEWDELMLSRILLRVFGLWSSPGANHIGEYIRWADEFLASQALQYFYDPIEGDPWTTGKQPRFIYNLGDSPTHVPFFHDAQDELAAELSMVDLKPSGELAIPIMESLSCGVPHDLGAVIVPNKGLIPGLDDDIAVEVPAKADSAGVHPVQMARLPEAITAILRTQGSIQKLLVEAYAEHSRHKLLQALLLDPTTDSYRNSVALINHLCDLQKDLLPDLRW